MYTKILELTHTPPTNRVSMVLLFVLLVPRRGIEDNRSGQPVLNTVLKY